MSISSQEMRSCAAAVLILSAFLAACSPGSLIRQFEYEEETYLYLDGSATVVVNASIPALVVMHGLPLKVERNARVDRAALRRLFEAQGVRVTRVSRPWRRHGRRFVQVRLDVDDVRSLPALRAFAWSDYVLERRAGLQVYRQVVKAPSGAPLDDVGWDGSELVGFRLHVPSRIVHHNAPSRAVERGNILSWEQPLRDRLAGVPIEIEVRMESQSILRHTMTVFVAAAVAALGLLTAAVYWVWRKGRAAQPTARGPGRAA